MSEDKKISFFEKMFGRISSLRMDKTNKYISPFVKRMRAIDTLNKPRLLWNSSLKGTYIRTKHGELK